jgi:hypothetical protein
MSMVRWVFVLLALGLASCAEYEAQKQAEANAAAARRAENDDAHCRSYGVQPGSNAYVQCRMNLDNQHAQDFMQRRALAVQLMSR